MSPVFLLPQPRKFSEAVCGWARGASPPSLRWEEAACQLSAGRRAGRGAGQLCWGRRQGEDSLACFLGTVGAGFFLAAAFRAKPGGDRESSVPGYFSGRPEALVRSLPLSLAGVCARVELAALEDRTPPHRCWVWHEGSCPFGRAPPPPDSGHP